MKKAISAFLLALCLAFSCALPALAAEGYGNLRRIQTYADGVFSDVSPDAWYRDGVAAVYELGLMEGDGGVFGVEQPMLLSEAVTLSARLHSLYRTGSVSFPESAGGEAWYAPYVAYALENGLLDAEGEDFAAEATRARFAVLLARALPAAALPPVNEIADGALPDVKMDTAGAEEIYRLYRAGVRAGSNAYGSFFPQTPIGRGAAAAIVSRMAYRSLRQKFELEQRVWPDLFEMPAADAEYFADAAMLGNSLVDGMKLYSGLEMDYYGLTGATVFENDAGALLEHSYGKVYLEFGINELSYNTAPIIAAYGEIIDQIRTAMPEAELYVMSLTPVTEKRDDGGMFTQRAIEELNAALKNLCAEKRCWYVDVFSPLLDEDGWLAEDYAGWDGSPHLSTEGYRAWADVLRTYYV